MNAAFRKNSERISERGRKMRKWVYLSHPCVPADADRMTEDELDIAVIKNREETDTIAKLLHKENDDVVIINPLMAGKWIDGSRLQHLNYDFELLRKCDAIIMSGDWMHSLGCMTEFGFTRARHMEFLTYSQDGKIKPGMNFSTR